MNYRINTTALTAVTLLVVVALGLFGYTYFLLPEKAEAPTAPTEDVALAPSGEIVTAQHQFKDGIHTIAGELLVPSPCHRLESEAFVAEGGAIEVRLSKVLIDGSDMCAQVLTPARFKVTFEAPENASITALIDRVPVGLNLIPVPEGESLDSFEMFIKG